MQELWQVMACAQEEPHTAPTLSASGAGATFPLSPASGVGGSEQSYDCRHRRPCPHASLSHLAQVHGSRLRLLQVSRADSGEYVCRVENGAGHKEATITISVLHSTHTSPNNVPGKEAGGAGKG